MHVKFVNHQGEIELKKILKSLLGVTISAIGIAAVLNSGLGCFSITAANVALSNWFGFSIGTANFITEGAMLAYATYKKEGVGWTAIFSATVGSVMIDIFNAIIPLHPLSVIGLVLLPLGLAFEGSAGLGETGSNMMLTAILKNSKRNFSVSFLRTVLEVSALIIGFLGARDLITPFTVIVSFGFGTLMQFIYKLVKFEPDKTEHKFIISKERFNNEKTI